MNSPSRRKGISLSLSKRKPSQERTERTHNPIIPQQRLQVPSKVQKVIHPYAHTVRFQSRGRPTSIDSSRQPKIVYQVRKTEWENMKQQNMQKAILVNSMKQEIQGLNRRLEKNFQQPKVVVQQKRKEKVFQKEIIPERKVLETVNEKEMEQTVIKEEESVISGEKQNIETQEFTTNVKQVENMGKTFSFSQKEKQEIFDFTIKKEKSTMSQVRQNHRKNIDIQVLVEIENRLEQLIGMTQA